ncbi:MAG: glycosyltransferase family 2 protein [Prevotella sp.]|nr:glycosyltransferase family 2 protein [Prevotella sp.]
MEISVIIPVWNKADYIGPCLDSLLGQAFDSFEIVIVDDGSTDDSGALCDRRAEADGRIRVIHTENGGVTAARRKGVEAAQGRYIVFVDADDQLLPGALTTLYRAIETAGADEVIATFCTQDGVQSPIHEGQPDTDAMIRTIITGKNRFPILWAVIFRREILSGCLNIPRDIIEGEDLMMQVQVLMKQPRVWFIRDCVYRYYLGLPNSRRHTLERAKLYDQLLRDILAPKWETMQTAYVLHQLKECEQFIVEGQPEVKQTYYQKVVGRLPQGIPLYNRIVWTLPPVLSVWLIRLYKKLIRIKQHNL